MSQNLQLRFLPTPEEIARVSAVEWLGILRRRGDLSVAFGVALSGGRIARTFYEAVVAAALQCGEKFDAVHFFWADERCVPQSDPENNYAVARQYLFEPLRISSENIHRIRGEVDAAYAIQEAEAEICRILPLNESGQPILDLIFLGMGEDGHVASLFPEESLELIRDPRVYRKVTATKPPPDRITLGYQPILSAKEVWVLASGPGKADAVNRLRAGNSSLPVTRVVKNRGSTMVFHDSE